MKPKTTSSFKSHTAVKTNITTRNQWQPNKLPKTGIKTLLIVVFIFVLAVPQAHAAGKKLNPWEQGSFDVFDASIGKVMSKYAWVEMSLANYNRHTSKEWLSRYPERAWKPSMTARFRRRQCALAMAWIEMLRTAKKNPYTDGKTLYAPDTISPFINAVINGMAYSRSRKSIRSCARLSVDELNAFMEITKRIKNEREKIYRLRRHRQAVGWSTTFSVELGRLPIKVEFIEGSFKFKVTHAFGRVKVDGQTGIKANSSNYKGLSYVVFLVPNDAVYVFQVRGLDFDLQLLASYQRFRGPILYIECDYNCARSLRSIN